MSLKKKIFLEKNFSTSEKICENIFWRYFDIFWIFHRILESVILASIFYFINSYSIFHKLVKNIQGVNLFSRLSQSLM